MWKLIPEWERYHISTQGYVFDSLYQREVSQFLNGDPQDPTSWYFRLGLTRYIEGIKERRIYYTHRLVYTAFVCTPGELLVHHRDGNAFNNSLNNLELTKTARGDHEQPQAKAWWKAYREYTAYYNNFADAPF